MVRDENGAASNRHRTEEQGAARLSVSPRRVTFVLGVISLLLTIIGFAAGLLTRDFGMPFLLATFRRLFHLNGEGNVPTWYSASLLLLCAVLLAIIALHMRQTRSGYSWHWAVLALLFLFLSVDESSRLHEPVSTVLRARLGTTGALVHAWVIPYAVFVLVVTVSYLRFLLHLPTATRRWFLLAGAVYVGGALGMEMVAGVLSEVRGWGREDNLRYAVPVEELCEMLGVVIFIHGLLSHLGTRVGELRMEICRP